MLKLACIHEEDINMNNSILNNKIALIEYVSNCEELSRNIKYKGLYGQNAWEYAVESLKSIPDFNLLDDDTKLDRLIVEALFFNIVYYIPRYLYSTNITVKFKLLRA